MPIEDELHEKFSSCGEIYSCQIYLDVETDESKGFAQVQYANAKAAQQAVAKLNGAQLDGHKLHVRPLPSKGRATSIFVGGFGTTTTRAQLEVAFSSAGEIAACQLFRDRYTKESLGQGKITYFFPEAVPEAVKYHMTSLGGHRIAVWEWKEGENGRRLPGPLAYVSRLSKRTTKAGLITLIKSLGDIVLVEVMIFLDKDTLESKGTAKIEFGDADSLRKCIENLDGAHLDGNMISIREFSIAAPPRQLPGPAVFVSGLNTDTVAEQLRELFSKSADVLFVDIQLTGRVRTSWRPNIIMMGSVHSRLVACCLLLLNRARAAIMSPIPRSP